MGLEQYRITKEEYEAMHSNQFSMESRTLYLYYKPCCKGISRNGYKQDLSKTLICRSCNVAGLGDWTFLGTEVTTIVFTPAAEEEWD